MQMHYEILDIKLQKISFYEFYDHLWISAIHRTRNILLQHFQNDEMQKFNHVQCDLPHSISAKIGHYQMI